MLTGVLLANGELGIKYELEVDFKPEIENHPARLDGVNRVWVENKWNAPISELYLRVPPDGHGNNPGNLTGKIRCSRLGKVGYTSGNTIQVGLFPALKPGETVVLDIPFTTWFSHIPSQTVSTIGRMADTTIYNLIDFYPSLEYFYPDGWRADNYQKRQRPFSNLADYAVTFTYPAGFEIGTSGKTVDIDTVTSEIIREHSEYGPATDFSAVLSTAFQRTQTTIAGIDLELLFTSDQESLVLPVIETLRTIIPFYQAEFGPCPHDRLTITMAYSLDATVVTRTNFIIFQDGFMSASRLLPREFARQWFGNAINADETYETWLNESFAEYAAGRYRTSVQGGESPALFSSMRGMLMVWRDLENLTPEETMRLIYNLFGRDVVPPIYEPNRQINWESQAQVYSRYIVGSHALGMLESAVGDSLMHTIMQAYASENTWHTVNTETFIATVDRFTSPQIGANFRLALTTNLRPDYKIVDVINSGRPDRQWDTKIKTDFDGSWNLPVDIETVTAAGDTLRLERVRFQQDGEINLVGASAIVKATVDPDKQTFDANRFNNRWPRAVLLQPIYGLPSWEFYKLYYRPVLRQDWRDNWRFGFEISGGLGINLMPILPAYYQNNFDLQLSYAPELKSNQLGINIGYRTPLGSVERTYWEMRSNIEYPRNENSLSISRYLGKTRYLVANRQSAYQRLTGRIQRTEFSTTDADQRWLRGKLWFVQGEFTRFRYSLQQRSNVEVAVRAGKAYQKHGGAFYRFSSLFDFEQHLWDSIILRTHFENGLVWDERNSNYLRFRLKHKLRAWRPRDEFVPLFRGITPVDEKYWNTVIGGGFSVGAETNLPAWPMVFMDAALVESGGANLGERWDNLTGNPVYLTGGLGVESQSWVEMGVYFPLWISHPVKDNRHWGLRWLVELGFYF